LLAIFATPTYAGGERKVCFYFFAVSTFVFSMSKILPFEQHTK